MVWPTLGSRTAKEQKRPRYAGSPGNIESRNAQQVVYQKFRIGERKQCWMMLSSFDRARPSDYVTVKQNCYYSAICCVICFIVVYFSF